MSSTKRPMSLSTNKTETLKKRPLTFCDLHSYKGVIAMKAKSGIRVQNPHPQAGLLAGEKQGRKFRLGQGPVQREITPGKRRRTGVRNHPSTCPRNEGGQPLRTDRPYPHLRVLNQCCRGKLATSGRARRTSRFQRSGKRH